jgi:hypothetical protein
MVEVQPGSRSPPGDGAADVDEVAVTVGSSTEHRVGEHDRVGFGPCDVLTERGPLGELIRRARPGGSTPHAHVGVHLFPSHGRCLGVEPHELGVQQIQRRDVQRGRHRDTGVHRPQSPCKIQPRDPMEQTAVDVRGGDVEQAIRTGDRGDPSDDPHRERNCLPAMTVEHLAVSRGEVHGHGGHPGTAGRARRRVPRDEL